MTPGSNHALLSSRKDTEATCCTAYRPQKPRPEKVCTFSGARRQNQKHPKKSLCLRTCLKFCFKGRAKMEQQEPHMGSPTEGTDRRLRELAAKWFIETQVPFIIHNGFFPSWFLGFITRKDAEEILKEKELGCFLIRLSDKAIGYILSYRGRDRCRHFVINQSVNGQFAVSGDSANRHDSVSDIIEHYKTSPIQPFGEYLTSSCFEALNEELYDIIQVTPKEKPVSTGRAVKNAQRQHHNVASEPTSTRPTKSNRTLEELPPLPRRSRHFDSASMNEQDRVLYAQLRKQGPRSQNISPGSNPRKAQRSTTPQQSPPFKPDANYSELSLLESSKSKSLPLLDSVCDRERCYRLSAPPSTPPRLSPKPYGQASGSGAESEPGSNHSLDYINENAVYHLAGSPRVSSETMSMTSDQQSNSLYAEVSAEALFSCYNTYELIPGHEDAGPPQPSSNTYEPLEDIRPKPSKNENGKWKWFFPDYKKK